MAEDHPGAASAHGQACKGSVQQQEVQEKECMLDARLQQHLSNPMQPSRWGCTARSLCRMQTHAYSCPISSVGEFRKLKFTCKPQASCDQPTQHLQSHS
jgi:hypothetical protein